MNKYFESIKRRCEKIADIVLDSDKGKQFVEINTIKGIINDEAEDYKNNSWHYLYKNDTPVNYYGVDEIWVIVKYKNPRWLKPMEIVKYKFDIGKFVSTDGFDVTDKVVKWTDIPYDAGDCFDNR